jgi:hypothetical protein
MRTRDHVVPEAGKVARGPGDDDDDDVTPIGDPDDDDWDDEDEDDDDDEEPLQVRDRPRECLRCNATQFAELWYNQSLAVSFSYHLEGCPPQLHPGQPIIGF